MAKSSKAKRSAEKTPQKKHFTKPFLKMWETVEAIVAEDGEVTDRARIAFRDGCLRLGHEERVKNLYRICDKTSNEARFFVMNGPQAEFLATKTNRNVILKSRQVGFTTLQSVRGLDKALWEANAKCLILAHLQNTVVTIFTDLVKYSYSWFLKDWGSLYRPTEQSESKTELSFKDDGLGRDLQSTMRVLFDGRGKTVNFLHISEASRVEDDRLLGTLQGCPANGEVTYESTANGRVGDFYRQYMNSKRLKHLAPYKGYFFPWYMLYPEEPQKWHLPVEVPLTPYEKELMEKSDGAITEAHIAWRRWCIEANCQGDPERFENEYPTDDETAFFTGDAQVIPQNVLKAQAKNVRPSIKTAFLISEGPGKVSLLDDPKAPIAFWEMPEPHYSYVIGADPSGGVGRDNGAAFVLCQQTGRFVARLWGQLTPDDFTAEIFKLATFYNKAWICPEANNHGHAVISGLKQRGYANLYKRKTIDDRGMTQSVVGFLTTNESKLNLTEKLKSALTNGRVTVLDNDLLSELSAFVQVAGKNSRTVRREALPGAHDDLVMAAALAVEMDVSRPSTNMQNEVLSAPEPESWGRPYDEDTGF
jgi:hypothetical protein